MKKILLSLIAITFLIAACQGTVLGDGDNSSSNDSSYSAPNQASSEELQAPISTLVEQDTSSLKKYSDWDRALRADTDMQNMYAMSPTKIEKPLDMYMVMSLSLKYNYSRRLISYEKSIQDASTMPLNKIPDMLLNAGYVNTNNSKDVNSDLKTTWNLLDVTSIAYQHVDPAFKSSVAYEQERKVIHNLLQETRTLYWKALTAQRLLPLTDDMIEYMTLQVDEINSKSRSLSDSGLDVAPSDLQKKRDYMEAVKKLSSLKREMETAETRLASLMGFHPSTEYKLVGKEYGNFELPTMRNSSVQQLEWLAITNRPELRAYDVTVHPDDLKVYAKSFQSPTTKLYERNADYYNKMWSKKAREVGLTILEDMRDPNMQDLKSLRRQRMTSVVVSQVYVSWANYMSAMEDYQINQEIADTSEGIAEYTAISGGVKNIRSHLEAARAIEDEVRASLSYVDMQEALGNLYATAGLDALPYYMVYEKPSKIAVYLRTAMDKWREGVFVPDNRPYMMGVPTSRPPVNLSNHKLLPDVEVETGQRIHIPIPQTLFRKLDLSGKITTKAGLINDKPLPKWLKYDEKNMVIYGVAMPGDIGENMIKIYVSDEKGATGYAVFGLKVVEIFVPSVKVDGLTSGRKAQVLKRCQGQGCKDDYVDPSVIGQDVEYKAQ